MKVISVSSSAEATDETGKVYPVRPQIALGQAGPLLTISVRRSEETGKELRQKRAKVGQLGIKGRALIDTGATRSVIDEKLAEALNLLVIDSVPIATPSHSNHLARVYSGIAIEIETGANNAPTLFLPRVIGAPLQEAGFQALLGRDFLLKGVLIYSGPTGNFSLCL